jgi:hypothetical protein
MHDDRYHCKNQQNVNEAARNVKGSEPQQPGNENYGGDDEKHTVSFFERISLSRRTGSRHLNGQSNPAILRNSKLSHGVKAPAMISRIVMLTLAALTVEAQTLPTFEVASVKPNRSADTRTIRIQFLSGGRFIATNYPLVGTIAAAWNVPIQSPGSAAAPTGSDLSVTISRQKGPCPPGYRVRRKKPARD